MSLATSCSTSIPMPTFTLSLRTQHRSGAPRVLRAVVEARARRGVLRRVGLERRDRVVERPGEDPVPVPEQPHRAGLPEEHVVVLELQLVPEVLPEPEVDRQLVRVLRRRHVREPHRPVVPVQLHRRAVRVAARVGR